MVTSPVSPVPHNPFPLPPAQVILELQQEGVTAVYVKVPLEPNKIVLQPRKDLVTVIWSGTLVTHELRVYPPGPTVY